MMFKELNVLNKFQTSIFTPILSLFTSFSTLLCCAIPALLVAIGAGATLASFLSVFPWITAISSYKFYVFVVAGIILFISAYLYWRNRNAPCPSDPELARSCLKLRSINFSILITSLLFYLVGCFFAYLADDIFLS